MTKRDVVARLPDAITLLNLLLGFASIVSLTEGRLRLASFLVFLAVLADSFDGFVARRKGVPSRFGMELDSLADLVSFGVAPGLILYNLFDHSRFAYFSVLIPVCGALRLARFNIAESKEGGFTGLPIPAAGGFAASLTLIGKPLDDVVLLFITIFLSALMVSELRYVKYSLKSGKKPLVIYMLAASMILPLLSINLLFAPFLVYILSGFTRRTYL
jgi:CDP-diacylglycerol--serine O-phosphatidyltransferase